MDACAISVMETGLRQPKLRKNIDISVCFYIYLLLRINKL